MCVRRADRGSNVLVEIVDHRTGPILGRKGRSSDLSDVHPCVDSSTIFARRHATTDRIAARFATADLPSSLLISPTPTMLSHTAYRPPKGGRYAATIEWTNGARFMHEQSEPGGCGPRDRG